MLRLFLSLFLTEIIEVPLSCFFLKQKKGTLIVFLVNILTNLPAVYLCMLARLLFRAEFYHPLQLLFEAVVVITEGLIYRLFSDKFLFAEHPFRMSLILNSISYGTGILINLGVQYLW